MTSVLFGGEVLRPGEHGILWRSRSEVASRRLSIVGQAWSDLGSTLGRLLRRCPVGEGLLQGLKRDFLRLENPGAWLAADLNESGRLSVVHAYALADEPIEPTSRDGQPVVLVVGRVAIVFWSTDRARNFARRVNRSNPAPVPWEAYPGEIGPSGYQGDFAPLATPLGAIASGRRHDAHTLLEEALCDSLSVDGQLPERRRRLDDAGR